MEPCRSSSHRPRAARILCLIVTHSAMFLAAVVLAARYLPRGIRRLAFEASSPRSAGEPMRRARVRLGGCVAVSAHGARSANRAACSPRPPLVRLPPVGTNVTDVVIREDLPAATGDRLVVCLLVNLDDLDRAGRRSNVISHIWQSHLDRRLPMSGSHRQGGADLEHGCALNCAERLSLEQNDVGFPAGSLFALVRGMIGPHWQCGGQGFEPPQLHFFSEALRSGVYPGRRAFVWSS
jgi:hypothetical protein